ncbi:hypothetical protein Trydic_g10949 [Trypoxylus dichotomus]
MGIFIRHPHLVIAMPARDNGNKRRNVKMLAINYMHYSQRREVRGDGEHTAFWPKTESRIPRANSTRRSILHYPLVPSTIFILQRYPCLNTINRQDGMP